MPYYAVPEIKVIDGTDAQKNTFLAMLMECKCECLTISGDGKIIVEPCIGCQYMGLIKTYLNKDWCLGTCPDPKHKCKLVAEETCQCPDAILGSCNIVAEAVDGQVLISWVTDGESNSEGFYILRSNSQIGPYTRINETLIPSKGSFSRRANYSFIDHSDLGSDNTYYYKVVEVDITGEQKMFGPVATAFAISGDTVSQQEKEETKKEKDKEIANLKELLDSEVTKKQELLYTVVAYSDGSMDVIENDSSMEDKNLTPNASDSQTFALNQTEIKQPLSDSSKKDIDIITNIHSEDRDDNNGSIPQVISFRIVDSEGTEVAVTQLLPREDSIQTEKTQQAKWDGNNITITWYADKPVKNFIVLRSNNGVNFTKITKIPIPYVVGKQGQTYLYSFRDAKVEEDKLYHYRIDVLQTDRTILYGNPIVAQPRLMNRAAIQ